MCFLCDAGEFDFEDEGGVGGDAEVLRLQDVYHIATQPNFLIKDDNKDLSWAGIVIVTRSWAGVER